jgi:hypothetical protein
MESNVCELSNFSEHELGVVEAPAGTIAEETGPRGKSRQAGRIRLRF